MEPLTFRDVATLINRIGNTSISQEPIRKEERQWEIYEGVVQSGGISLRFHVLYFLADAVAESFRTARNAVRHLPSRDPLQVVYPKSLAEKYSAQVRLLSDISKNVLPLPDYLSSFIRQQVDTYLVKIRGLPHRHYVDPQITVPAGVSRKTPNPVLTLLSDDDLGMRGHNGALGVLLAEPGQGKTFMSKFLASRLARSSLVPIYVHSEQWSQIRPEDLSSLWKTIVHSFRYFECPIGWIEGAEQEFLRVALKAGLFRIIFDGFDEYVLWNNGRVDALDTVATLQQLAEDTGARILITSRTSFWEAEVGDDYKSNQATSRTFTYTIEPFDLNHARNYFTERFPTDSSKVRKASDLFQLLRSRTSQSTSDFVGRGFFLYHIADLVDRTPVGEQVMPDGESVVGWMISALCERERTRQQLSLTAAQQVEALSEFAVLQVSGEPPSSETLSMVLSVIAGLSPERVTELVGNPERGLPGKLTDHPIIKRVPLSDEWYFVQGQIMYVLLADRVIQLARSVEADTHLRALVTTPKFASSLLADVATALVEHVYDKFKDAAATDVIRRVIASLLRCVTKPPKVLLDSTASTLACTIAALANNRERPKGSSRAEKTQHFISLFPGGRLDNLTVTGTLSRFDFHGVTFSNCVFEKVTWANCRFDETTHFHKCRFSAGSIQSCEGFGKAAWASDCFYDRDALALIDAERIKEGKKSYTIEDLKLDVNTVIKKFVPKEGAGIRTVEERNLKKGPIANSKYRDEILEQFKRFIIEPHHISGMDGMGYNVRPSAVDCVLHYSANGVPTGPLADLHSVLRSKLGI